MSRFYSVTENQARRMYPIVHERKVLGLTYREVAAKHHVSPKTLSWYSSYFSTPQGKDMIQKITQGKEMIQNITVVRSEDSKVVGCRAAAKILNVCVSTLHRRLNKNTVPMSSVNAAIRDEDSRKNGYVWRWRDVEHLTAWWAESLSVEPYTSRTEVSPRAERAKTLTTSESAVQGKWVVVRHDLVDQLTALMQRLNDPIVRKYRLMMGQPEELTFDQLANMVIELGITNWDTE